MSDTLTEIMELFPFMQADHEPDGWPAIRMDQVAALYDEVLRLRGIIETYDLQVFEDIEVPSEEK
jgi:hypothetical protein